MVVIKIIFSLLQEREEVKMKKQFTEYYLGLDLGTASVGWAVTDLNYNIQKFNGKAMWGSRLFDEAKTAEERRVFRSGRRRNGRRKQRIQLLQELFAEEICKVDPGFFIRLKDSKYWEEDKEEKQSNTLFNDLGFKDKEYGDKYKTIYHLRNDLIEDASQHDIRLVYLALHHIIKNRGHFLYPGDFKDVGQLKLTPLLESLEEVLKDDLGIIIEIKDVVELEELLINQGISITNKKKDMENNIIFDKEYAKCVRAIIGLLAGGKVELKDVLCDEALAEEELNRINFKDSTFDDNEENYRELLADKFDIIESLKSIYDWGILKYILGGENSISAAKVKKYNEHNRDLKQLKIAIREYCPDKYDSVFREQVDKSNNYSAYIGNYRTKGRKEVIEKTCSQEELCEFLRKKIFCGIEIDNDKYPKLADKILYNNLLPKQRIKDNGVIPYQIQKKELEDILNNASKYLDFLNKEDENGMTVQEKVVSILTYRIPYYVGPINGAHKQEDGKGFYWAEKLSNEKVRPWNFEEVIDLEKSAEKFIKRMTNKCTYLLGADVIPKNSLLYSKYMVLNELNNLRIDNEKVSVGLKQEIFNDLFMRQRKVTGRQLKEYLITRGHVPPFELSGFDITFKGNMGTYLDFSEILGKENFTDDENEMIEEIVKFIVLFGDDKKMLKNKITKNYGTKLSEDQIKRISKKKYSGWGQLSTEFLTQIREVDKETGEIIGDNSIINCLYSHPDNPNLMQLLSNDFGFALAVQLENRNDDKEKQIISYNDLEELYISAPVKRSVWQTVTIVKELRKIMGHDPKKIFIEMAKGSNQNDKKRTKSRKEQLMELYKACKADESILMQLQDEKDDSLRSDKLFLYYLQMCKCMYTGEIIRLEDLGRYDIDHIYPQSKIMDDSLNNRVLVTKESNAAKGDSYPIKFEIQDKMKTFWDMLLYKGLISKEKHMRLHRKNEFTDGELASFVERQLVETRQSTKAVAHLFEELFPKTQIVYVKAGNVSRFRQGVNDCPLRTTRDIVEQREADNVFIKVRDINDYHHAKDAYLNIVVGNVYHTKFTANPQNFFKNKTQEYSLNAIYRLPVSRDGIIAWEPTNFDNLGTMETVKKYMNKNNIQFTRYAKEARGGLFDQTIMKKGKGQMPIKASDDKLSSIEKYGGYNKVTGAYFFLVEHKKKGKVIKSFEFVPLYMTSRVRNNKEELIKYCTEDLQLEEPRILMERIKMDTLFEIDGFRMHLSGRTGDRLIFKNGNQLILTKNIEKLIKAIIKVATKYKDDSQITVYDKVTQEQNLQVYNELLNKLETTVYSVKLSTQKSNLENGINKFKMLNTLEQCKVIEQVLHTFQCNSATTDIKLIGGGNSTAIILMSKNVSKDMQLYIINQSPTGLFEERINLAEL